MVTRRSIEELIEASSLGTPEAKALRESVSPERARQIVARAFPNTPAGSGALSPAPAEQTPGVVEGTTPGPDGRDPAATVRGSADAAGRGPTPPAAQRCPYCLTSDCWLGRDVCQTARDEAISGWPI